MPIPPPRESPGSATAALEGDALSVTVGVGSDSTGEVPAPRRRRSAYFPRDPDLEIDQILSWADAHHQRTGEWPTAGSGLIPELSGERWRNIDQALRTGLRGLEAGSSLARLLALHRDRRNLKALPHFSEAQILAWADAYRERTGEWPKLTSGSIPESPGDQWTHVNAALRSGHRGLRGGLSLARLLAFRRGRPKGPALPPLSEPQILGWADAHRIRTGRWPKGEDGPIPEASGETWAAVDTALIQGCRGLEGRSSLARLLALERGVANAGEQPPLSEAQILSWAIAYHHRKGRWPRRGSGPIAEASGDTWGGVDAALSQGQRGLPGGSSLVRLCCESAAASRAASPPPPPPVERAKRLSPHLAAIRPKSLPLGEPSPSAGCKRA
jgi:hypothetical protein